MSLAILEVEDWLKELRLLGLLEIRVFGNGSVNLLFISLFETRKLSAMMFMWEPISAILFSREGPLSLL